MRSAREWMRRGAVAVLVAGVAAGIVPPSPAAPTEAGAAGEEPDSRDSKALARKLRAGVGALADDSMEGRGLGTGGIRRAASWIEGQLRAIGLEPAFGPSYRQSFRVKTGVKPLPGNRLDGVADDAWTPLGFSSSGDFAGELAFAGYGIESPEVGYRELDGLALD